MRKTLAVLFTSVSLFAAAPAVAPADSPVGPDQADARSSWSK